MERPEVVDACMCAIIDILDDDLDSGHAKDMTLPYFAYVVEAMTAVMLIHDCSDADPLAVR